MTVLNIPLVSESITPTRDYGVGRVCAGKACHTILSRYNNHPGELCAECDRRKRDEEQGLKVSAARVTPAKPRTRRPKPPPSHMPVVVEVPAPVVKVTLPKPTEDERFIQIRENTRARLEEAGLRILAGWGENDADYLGAQP